MKHLILLINLLSIGKLTFSCDTSQFNNFDLTWFSGPVGDGNEAYAQNGLEDFKKVSLILFTHKSSYPITRTISKKRPKFT